MAAHQELAGGAVGDGGEQFVDDAGVEAVALGADIAGPLFLGVVPMTRLVSVEPNPSTRVTPNRSRNGCQAWAGVAGESPRTARWARSCGPGGWASSIGTMAPSR
ncbi:hypothetical protein [Streptomyces melanosporofaciens]|uniref:hypothetical protein n=1 Tax=Streptomyces melanosporofaciens TaxID=67327 RepID=UPI001FCC90F7|nr:hypothetical protein [Streptomyces melanosporofaciens]